MTIRLSRTLALAGTGLVLLAWGVTSLRPYEIASAQQVDKDVSYISVTGDGEVRAEPDMATVTVGVSQTGATSGEAMDAVNRTLAAVISSVRALGIESRDIQTSGLSLQPVYRNTQRTNDQPPEIVGYRASNSLTITVRNLSQAGPVLDAAVAAGANSIGGIRFGITDTDTLKRQALASATADAESKARAIAASAGVSLAGVLSITESSVSVPRPVADTAFRAAPAPEASAPTPVEGGELVVRARVQASYRI
jgi:hypothetical protein